MDNKQVESLVRLRDAFTMASDTLNDYVNSLAPAEVRNEKKTTAAVNELNFTTLKFETQKGAKLGDYEVAYKNSNLPEKWSSPFNVLNASNATIQNRYYGAEYVFSYWLYGSDKIYRKKLIEKTGEKPSHNST